jgi:hypothetical protein
MELFCKKDEIPENTPKELEALYECKNATRCLADAVKFNKEVSDKNKKISDNFEKDLNTYKIAKSEHLNKLDNWQKKIGEFSEYSKRDGVNREFWAADYDNGLCRWDQNGGAANDACQWAANKQGYNGDRYFAKGWGYCTSLHGAVNFLCKKPDDVVASEINEYMSKKPVFSLAEPKESDYAKIQQIPIDNASISCCTNYINSSGDITDNVQSCSQKVEDKIKNYIPPKPIIPIISATATSPFTSSDSIDNSPEDFSISTEIIIAIVIAVFVLLSFSSGLAFLFIGKK